MVNSAHNGVQMHIAGAQKIFYLYNDVYIVVTIEGLIYAQLSIDKPRIVCRLP